MPRERRATNGSAAYDLYRGNAAWRRDNTAPELPELPELNEDGIFTEVAMEKQEWKNWIKAQVKAILKEKPEAVYVEGEVFYTYPVVHALRKKHVPVLTMIKKEERKLLIKIPSGS